MRIYELLEPKKPTKVKSSTITKAGVQGSTIKIAKKEFTTPSGNNVEVHFKLKQGNDGEKEAEVLFYVNGTMDDNSSTEGKEGLRRDIDILAGVSYVTKSYLDKAKISKCTFSAHGGPKDTKIVKDLPLDAPKKPLIAALINLKSAVANLDVSDQAPREASIHVEFNRNVEEMLALLSDITPEEIPTFTRLYFKIKNAIPKVYNLPEFRPLNVELDKFYRVTESYEPSGTTITKNRRFQVYSKIVNKFFSDDWNVETYGDSFTLTRT